MAFVAPAVGYAARYVGRRAVIGGARLIAKHGLKGALKRAAYGTAAGVAGTTAVTAAGGYVLGKRKAQKQIARPKKKSRVYKARSFVTSNAQGDMGSAIVKNVSLARVRPIDRRTLKLSFNKRVLRWQRCNVMNDALATLPGALALSHSTVNTNQTKCPCFMLCLNSTNNQSANTTVGPAANLLFNDTGGVVLEYVQPGNGDGTATQLKWITDYSAPDMNAGDNDPEVRYIMNAYYDIRLNCYGANNQPTKYLIQIVSFPDGYTDPLEAPSNTQEANDRHGVFQGLVQKYMANPILPFITPKRKLKVHASVSFVLQPTLNTENDTTPQSRVVKMFVRDGTIGDFMYHTDGFQNSGADDKLSIAQFRSVGNTGTADYSDFPAARARKWLIVRAMNTTRIDPLNETKANTPSFDIIVRKGEYLQAR